MSNYYKSTLDLIGNTPLVEVTNIEKDQNLEASVLVKLEYFNPGGSVKDRIAKAMIEDAESRGALKKVPLSLNLHPEIQGSGLRQSLRRRDTGSS